MIVGYDQQYIGGAKGLLTGKRVYSLDASDKYTITSYYYDDYGRMVQVHASNHLGGFEDEYTAYNFPGTIRQKLHIHTVPNKPVQKEVYSYTYDYVNRLLTTSHKLNDLPEKILLSNSYDEIGRLQKQSKATETSVYTYNVRDWLTGISGNFFSETLAYNTAVGGISPQVASYSGNISAMQWKAGMEKVIRGYQFRYDHINRLTHALYGEGNNITINDKYNEILTYDLMGNILTLRRHGKHDSGFGLIDKLAYKYNGNQLIKVTDAATTSVTSYGAFQFVDGADEENEYVYDANGNMTEDFNKKISKIEYNLLNLPTKLQFSFGHMAEYSYDGAGRKLSVTYKTSKTNLFVPMGSIVPPLSTNVALTLKTDYCGNMIYENGQLSKILTDVGYITLANSTPTYHYYLQDHLGNNRVVIDEHGQVEQVNHYYAFGGLMGESAGGGTQSYKYNGKELDRMHGLDWYDYGARHYDAVLGRWMCVDPLAEKYKSIGGYVYCIGNPIKLIDIDGLYPTGIISRETHKLKPAAIRLLSLVSGVEEKYIKKVVAVESSFLPSGYSMTTGSSPYKVTIHTGSNFFTSNDKKDNINILFNYAHEVGHIKQIAREYNLGSYVSKTIIKYIPFGHDASNWEQEADNGYRVLDNFWKYVQRFSRKGNPLESLFNNDKMSEENKMRIINKWWKSWQNYMQKEADNLIKNSTLIDMKKRTKQNLTEKKKMQLS